MKQATLSRSLFAIEREGEDDFLGLRKDRPIQQAALPNSKDVMSDARPDVGAFVSQGRLGGAILKQTPGVQIGCFGPRLIGMLKKASQRFGRPVVVTSGLRAGGRRGSYHRKCMAADIKIDGVSKQTLAAYFRSLPEAGGVGTYCHNGVVHIDTAEPRNWTYCGFRRTSFSLRNGGWPGGEHVRTGAALPDAWMALWIDDSALAAASDRQSIGGWRKKCCRPFR